MAPQLKEMTMETNETTRVVDMTPAKERRPSVETPATDNSSDAGNSPGSVKSTVSSSSTPSRGMGKKRPSLVFDVDDLELCMALQEAAPSFIEKMNSSYPEIINAYSRAFGDHPSCLKETEHAELTGLDRDGFVMDVTLKTNGNKDMAAVLKDVRVPYQGKVKSAEDLEGEAERMYKEACDKLGYMYKAQNGYYTKGAKQSLLDTYNAASKGFASAYSATSEGVAETYRHTYDAANKGLAYAYTATSEGVAETCRMAKENPMKASAVAVGVVAVAGGLTLGVRSLKRS